MIRFPCPGCGGKLKQYDFNSGKRVQCPHCWAAVEVPIKLAPLDEDGVEREEEGEEFLERHHLRRRRHPLLFAAIGILSAVVILVAARIFAPWVAGLLTIVTIGALYKYFDTDLADIWRKK
jgi:predicted nucleic acid-binding Zn ribbon protein